MSILLWTLPTITCSASELTDAIAQVESSFGRRLSSTLQPNNGWHGITDAAWSDVTKYRRKRDKTVYPRELCRDYEVSSLYCTEYLGILSGQLQALLGRRPMPAELLTAYHVGLTHFRRLNYYDRNTNDYSKRVLAIASDPTK